MDAPSPRRGRVFARAWGLVALAVAVVLVLAGAFVAERLASPTKRNEYRLAVVRGGAELGSYTIEDLRGLGVRREVMQTGPEEGPTLLSVLNHAGVTSFRQVTVEGLGVRDDGRLVLKSSEVDQHVLLDIALRGTAKICGPNIPREERVRDVVRLVVE